MQFESQHDCLRPSPEQIGYTDRERELNLCADAFLKLSGPKPRDFRATGGRKVAKFVRRDTSLSEKSGVTPMKETVSPTIASASASSGMRMAGIPFVWSRKREAIVVRRMIISAAGDA
jgi:hypothetical protein